MNLLGIKQGTKEVVWDFDNGLMFVHMNEQLEYIKNWPVKNAKRNI